MVALLTVYLLCLQGGDPSRTSEPIPGFRLPPDFVISQVADHTLADDIFCLTIDPRGRITVAGRGYIRILHDDDGDGRADRVTQFSDVPRDGAQGLLWEEDVLYCVGDGGLHKFIDKNNDNRADGPAQLLYKFRTGGEHNAHALRRGQDGWLYLLCGNTTGISSSFAASNSSPVKDPIAGCIVRFAPDWSTSEIVADGFRNAYGMDFNFDHELFTCDSDNERCLGLPWYEPTRFYHVIAGGNYGWRGPQRGETWRFPPHFPDVVKPVVTLDRGSPTAVECYRHDKFPLRYRGSIFVADWTFGRIYHLALIRLGGSYTTKPERFLESIDANGFAPTAMAVHPQSGDLFVACGGRGTRGAIYRIHYTGKPENHVRLDRPVTQTALIWNPEHKSQTLRDLTHPDLLIRRKALETVGRHSSHFSDDELKQGIQANAILKEAHIRLALVRLLCRLYQDNRTPRGIPSTPDIRLLLLSAKIEHRKLLRHELAEICTYIRDTKLSSSTRLESVRILQRHLGDIGCVSTNRRVLEGYTFCKVPDPGQVAFSLPNLREAFPSGDKTLDLELSRTLALVHDEDKRTLEKTLQFLTSESDPRVDLHYLIAASQLRAQPTSFLRDRIAQGLLQLDKKMVHFQLSTDRHWPMRIQELAAELCDRDQSLALALLRCEEFGSPSHILLVQSSGWDRAQVARKFWSRIRSNPEYPLTPDVIDLLAESSLPEVRSHIRQHWEEWGLRDAILRLLARQPEVADRALFLEGLGSTSWSTIHVAATALHNLQQKPVPGDYLIIFRTLKRLPDANESKQARRALYRLLAVWSGEHKVTSETASWVSWFHRTYPAEAAKLAITDGVDLNIWMQRLRKLDWSVGDMHRGALLFRKTGCAQCHTGPHSSGPDLAGVAQRFSREDLFTAIIQPSRDISPRYRASLVMTRDGKVHLGTIVYQAVDGMLLQTDTGIALRLAGNQVQTVRPAEQSLMPAGLIDRLTDLEVADLYAYLRTLQSKRVPTE